MATIRYHVLVGTGGSDQPAGFLNDSEFRRYTIWLGIPAGDHVEQMLHMPGTDIWLCLFKMKKPTLQLTSHPDERDEWKQFVDCDSYILRYTKSEATAWFRRNGRDLPTDLVGNVSATSTSETHSSGAFAHQETRSAELEQSMSDENVLRSIDFWRAVVRDTTYLIDVYRETIEKGDSPKVELPTWPAKLRHATTEILNAIPSIELPPRSLPVGAAVIAHTASVIANWREEPMAQNTPPKDELGQLVEQAYLSLYAIEAAVLGRQSKAALPQMPPPQPDSSDVRVKLLLSVRQRFSDGLNSFSDLHFSSLDGESLKNGGHTVWTKPNGESENVEDVLGRYIAGNEENLDAAVGWKYPRLFFFGSQLSGLELFTSICRDLLRVLSDLRIYPPQILRTQGESLEAHEWAEWMLHIRQQYPHPGISVRKGRIRIEAPSPIFGRGEIEILVLPNRAQTCISRFQHVAGHNGPLENPVFRDVYNAVLSGGIEDITILENVFSASQWAIDCLLSNLSVPELDKQPDTLEIPESSKKTRSNLTSRQRGPKVRFDPVADRKMHDDSEATGLPIKEFARLRGLNPKDVEKARKRHRKRLAHG